MAPAVVCQPQSEFGMFTSVCFKFRGGGAAFKGGEGGNLVENYAYIPSIDL